LDKAYGRKEARGGSGRVQRTRDEGEEAMRREQDISSHKKNLL